MGSHLENSSKCFFSSYAAKMAWRKALSDTERAAHNEECHLAAQDVGGRS